MYNYLVVLFLLTTTIVVQLETYKAKAMGNRDWPGLPLGIGQDQLTSQPIRGWVNGYVLA